jgi:uncharacterized protein (TIGR03067 family)
MRTRFLLVASAIAATSGCWIAAVAGGPDSIPPNGDLGRLQGRWTTRAGAHKDIQVVMCIKGKDVDLSINTPQGIRLKAQGQVKIDDTTSPRKLDWINFSSADQQEYPQVQGIYKVDGDRFTVCNGGFNGARPKEFRPGDGVLADVVVFQREQVASTAKGKSNGATKR